MSAATELELESELALEGEGEGEFELAGELEQELELAHELTNEFELEHEQEAEHEAFFNNLAAMADRSGRSQALRRIALTAARSALKVQAQPWPVVEGEGELGELEGELGEHEGTHEFELELEASPAQLAHFAAMMEHEGHAAAEAANEQEAAEHFLPLVGLAAKFVLPKLAGLAAKKLGGLALKKIGGKLIGRVGGQLLRRFAPRLIRRVAPQLTRGLANVTRTLYRNRSTRPLLTAVPPHRAHHRGPVGPPDREWPAHYASAGRPHPRATDRAHPRQSAHARANVSALARAGSPLPSRHPPRFGTPGWCSCARGQRPRRVARWWRRRWSARFSDRLRRWRAVRTRGDSSNGWMARADHWRLPLHLPTRRGCGALDSSHGDATANGYASARADVSHLRTLSSLL